jgi:hypothetical protein
MELIFDMNSLFEALFYFDTTVHAVVAVLFHLSKIQ